MEGKRTTDRKELKEEFEEEDRQAKNAGEEERGRRGGSHNWLLPRRKQKNTT
jgi:hypothetical protein